ncbi:hypothetical protein [Zobellia roscoffensis]|uniref:hypothetical protein n=1 Tax=Zobellia roscoffensis TaxID=2779508 RepID=UPI00188BCC89|nr:hypothetical protein [Zobellia roscoffensis]
MISLDLHTPNITVAKQLHHDKLYPIIKQRIDGLPASELKTFLADWRISAILTDTPEFLEEHHNDLLDAIPGYSVAGWTEFLRIKGIQAVRRNAIESDIFNLYNHFVEDINGIFKYTGGFARKTSPYSAYDLAESLNIQTCTYCNRIYTKTVRNPTKITRPEFDHWFPKESYPLLALSFFNLIPSCHVCNSSVKGKTVMSLDTFIHPYVDSAPQYKFSYRIDSYNKYKFQISRNSGSKEDATIKAFKLEEIYATHEDEIEDLVRLRKLYSPRYLLQLRTLLSKADQKVSIEELYRLAFGTHINEADFHKRPLSKMKKDILKELNIIK